MYLYKYYFIIYHHQVFLSQFDCTNTMSDQLLEKVRVQLEVSEGYQIVAEVPCQRLACSETSPTYIALQFPDAPNLTVSKL